MPRISLLTKEVIINAALEIVREEGLEALSARNIAKRMKSSTRPIYDAYTNMDEFRADLISKIKTIIFTSIFSYKKTGQQFFDLGLGYIYTAYTEPKLFRVYYEKGLGTKLSELSPSDRVVQALRDDLGDAHIEEENLLQIVINSWIFVYGLASFIASGTLVYNEEKVIIRLREIWHSILKRWDLPIDRLLY